MKIKVINTIFPYDVPTETRRQFRLKGKIKLYKILLLYRDGETKRECTISLTIKFLKSASNFLCLYETNLLGFLFTEKKNNIEQRNLICVEY